MTDEMSDDTVETATHAIITAAIHDMDGFAALGQVTVTEYETSPSHCWPADAQITYILDLWSRDGHFADKDISRETAAALLSVDPRMLDQTSRQSLAQINDDHAAHVRAVLARTTLTETQDV
jgi:hypothetical protein